MRKSTFVLAAVVTLFTSSALFANENTSNGDQPNQISTTMNEYQGNDPENSQINSEVNNLLRENAKMHRYSSAFEFIMVSDKIERKYRDMNYQAYRFFKYDVDFSQIGTDQE